MAVYRNETDQLARAAERLAKTMPPIEALRRGWNLFVDYLATKHGMTEVLDSTWGPVRLYASSGPT